MTPELEDVLRQQAPHLFGLQWWITESFHVSVEPIQDVGRLLAHQAGVLAYILADVVRAVEDTVEDPIFPRHAEVPGQQQPTTQAGAER